MKRGETILGTWSKCDNTKVFLKGVNPDDVDLIHLSEGKVQFQAVTNTVMSLPALFRVCFVKYLLSFHRLSCNLC